MPQPKTPKEYAELEPFFPILEMIPQIRKVVRSGIDSHLTTQPHTIEEITKERMVYKNALAVLQKKWSMDIIFVLNILKKCNYNELKKTLPEINSRSLTDTLLFLENNKIVYREVVSTRPFRVKYELSDYGKGLYELLLPASFYFIIGK